MTLKHTLFALIVVTFSFFMALLAVEAYLRIANHAPVKSTWLEMHERGFMMNRSDMSALHTHDDIRVRYQLSPQRTRGSEVDENRTNIWVFGDSFTFGLLLQESDTYLHHLNRFASREHPDSDVHFVNAGVGGTGLADWVAFLETYGHTYPIDGILFLHNYDDFERMIAKNLYILDNSELRTSKRWEETPLKQRLDNNRLWVWIQERSRLASYLQTLLWNTSYFTDVTEYRLPEYPMPPSFTTETDFLNYTTALTGRLYVETSRIADELEIPFWVSTTGFIHDDIHNDINGFVFSHLPDLLESAGVYYEDISPKLSELVEGDYDRIRIPRDSHPNPEGASLIARLLWNGPGQEIVGYFESDR